MLFYFCCKTSLYQILWAKLFVFSLAKRDENDSAKEIGIGRPSPVQSFRFGFQLRNSEIGISAKQVSFLLYFGIIIIMYNIFYVLWTHVQEIDLHMTETRDWNFFWQYFTRSIHLEIAVGQMIKSEEDFWSSARLSFDTLVTGSKCKLH